MIFGFKKKEDASLFADEMKEILKTEKISCVKKGGFLVSTQWLHDIVPPNLLQKHIRFAKSLGFKDLPNNIKTENIPVDPYFLGLWLGDGTSSNANITTMDPEILTFMENLALTLPGNKWSWVSVEKNSAASTYRLRDLVSETFCNLPFKNESHRKTFVEIMKADASTSAKEIAKKIYFLE